METASTSAVMDETVSGMALKMKVIDWSLLEVKKVPVGKDGVTDH